jgi:hypothetical protein
MIVDEVNSIKTQNKKFSFRRRRHGTGRLKTKRLCSAELKSHYELVAPKNSTILPRIRFLLV